MYVMSDIFRRADGGTGHCAVVLKFWGRNCRLANERRKYFNVERFSLKKLNVVEVTEQNQVKNLDHVRSFGDV